VQILKINDCHSCEYKILYMFFQKFEKFCQLKIVEKNYKQNFFNVNNKKKLLTNDKDNILIII